MPSAVAKRLRSESKVVRKIEKKVNRAVGTKLHLPEGLRTYGARRVA